MDTPASRACGIHAARLNLADYAINFGDAHPPLTRAQALIEAERCYYCHDAPCATACPTGIDIPSFIHRIAQDNNRGAARAILEANPLGGMCARVCPTEVLCEQACVLGCNLCHGGNMQLGHHQKVNRSPRADVVEDKNFLVFVDFFRGNLACDDFAEKAVRIVHG